MSTPDAASVPEGEDRDRIRRIVHRRGLVGLANTTKWNELLALMRGVERWAPAFRCKYVDSSHVTRWDSEWVYHPPMPMMVVEWMDICLVRTQRVGALVPEVVVEQYDWVVPALEQIGFDTLRAGDVVRVFGYAPHDLTGLDGA